MTSIKITLCMGCMLLPIAMPAAFAQTRGGFAPQSVQDTAPVKSTAKPPPGNTVQPLMAPIMPAKPGKTAQPVTGAIKSH